MYIHIPEKPATRPLRRDIFVLGLMLLLARPIISFSLFLHPHKVRNAAKSTDMLTIAVCRLFIVVPPILKNLLSALL